MVKANTITFNCGSKIEIDLDLALDNRVLNSLWDAVDKGVDLYHAAVASIAAACSCRWVYITELDSERKTVTVKAMWEQGRLLDCFEYELEGTPCDLVIKNEKMYRFLDVANKFPEDRLLDDLGVKDYIGVPIRFCNGQISGHIVLLNDNEFEKSVEIESLIDLIAKAICLDLNYATV